MDDIIFTTRSINNKNVRSNELKILEKHEDELYILIGEDNINTKKRIFKDLKTLNEDYEELKRLKEKQEKKQPEIQNRLSNRLSDKKFNQDEE